ncbi:SPFH domain-containing protein [Corticibacter populi]|uniref:SPFH domain-containing protein n=1 Tax=Corticibacter populi TaxID=1550736 RepID=A0A3M6QZL0_9BURK|nr:SPFH domain-containing protein [Corticibacter populi]RMX07972.1 SPFH domain-containing protein [Corticibacter populi]RZS35214.1 regulator of protease activity HflC (stomatin/prohibitin superfamily) [Corticibacter populi]
MKEIDKSSLPGIPFLAVSAVVLVAVVGFFRHPALLVVAVPAALVVIKGLYMLEPNQSAVLSLFGRYVGTVRQEGLRWNNPFFSKRRISLRVRNFESSMLKVNDLEGNPIEIAAVIVWQVQDSAEAVYNVDDYESYVRIQSEAALRALAGSYPYDQHEDGQVSLRSHPHEVSHELQRQIAERLGKAGVEVIEARISHLAYAPEIAQAMLQRQQANAVIAARAKIVAGAVGMVEMALAELEKNGTVPLDDAHKADLVGNLLVVLCSERGTQPVVQASSRH